MVFYNWNTRQFIVGEIGRDYLYPTPNLSRPRIPVTFYCSFMPVLWYSSYLDRTSQEDMRTVSRTRTAAGY